MEKLILTWVAIHHKVECLLEEVDIKEVLILEAEQCNLEGDRLKQAIRAVFNHKEWEPKISMAIPIKWVLNLKEEETKILQQITQDLTMKAMEIQIRLPPEVVKEEEVVTAVLEIILVVEETKMFSLKLPYLKQEEAEVELLTTLTLKQDGIMAQIKAR